MVESYYLKRFSVHFGYGIIITRNICHSRFLEEKTQFLFIFN